MQRLQKCLFHKIFNTVYYRYLQIIIKQRHTLFFNHVETVMLFRKSYDKLILLRGQDIFFMSMGYDIYVIDLGMTANIWTNRQITTRKKCSILSLS